MENFAPNFTSYFSELERATREECRELWTWWLARFGADRRQPWDSLQAAHIGRSVARVYGGFRATEIVFGSPGYLFKGSAKELPPYETWVETYWDGHWDDLYIWDAELSWTLVIHHEQFGGLVSGPLLAYPI